MTDKMRGAFESHITKEYGFSCNRWEDGEREYVVPKVQNIWLGWQAAQAEQSEQSEQSMPVVDIDATGLCYNGVHMAPVVDNITTDELERLRKDAERYKYIRDAGLREAGFPVNEITRNAQDEAIDAAIAAEGEKG